MSTRVPRLPTQFLPRCVNLIHPAPASSTAPCSAAALRVPAQSILHLHLPQLPALLPSCQCMFESSYPARPNSFSFASTSLFLACPPLQIIDYENRQMRAGVRWARHDSCVVFFGARCTGNRLFHGQWRLGGRTTATQLFLWSAAETSLTENSSVTEISSDAMSNSWLFQSHHEG